MDPSTVAIAVHRGGQVATWVVLLSLLGSVLFALAMVVGNWNTVGV